MRQKQRLEIEKAVDILDRLLANPYRIRSETLRQLWRARSAINRTLKEIHKQNRWLL